MASEASSHPSAPSLLRVSETDRRSKNAKDEDLVFPFHILAPVLLSATTAALTASVGDVTGGRCSTAKTAVLSLDGALQLIGGNIDHEYFQMSAARARREWSHCDEFLCRQSGGGPQYGHLCGEQSSGSGDISSPSSRYDPTKFQIIGGLGRGGTVLLINSESESACWTRLRLQ
jgi:hypothetical protein